MFVWKKYVYEVYKERSFTKAAQNLYISQPSLSARIKKIEEIIGEPLFDRSTTPLQLTEVGKVYIEAAEEITQIEQRVENYINDLAGLKTGNLAVGASTLFAAYVVPSLITQFNQKFPDVHIQLIEGNTAELEEMLLDGSTFRLWDNADENPKVSLKTSLTDSELNEQGIHEVYYLLSDHVGNEKTVKRYVKMISSANLKITANGQMMLPCDTTILKASDVELKLEKSKRNGESFKVYYEKGIQKAGVMKKASVTKDGRLTGLEAGFYTLYVVTQNKETYLTYLYIDTEQW